MKTNKKYKITKIQLDWINDLIAGRFRKTEEALGTQFKGGHVGYCCLGVACVVAKRHGIDVPKTIWDNKEVCFDGQNGELSPKLVDIFKLRSSYGKITEEINGSDSLAELNDDLEWSHKKIGEYILKNPTKVFKS